MVRQVEEEKPSHVALGKPTPSASQSARLQMETMLAEVTRWTSAMATVPVHSKLCGPGLNSPSPAVVLPTVPATAFQNDGMDPHLHNVSVLL